MAINRESNAYTFIFAIIMVVVVGAVLSIAAISLKPYQDANLKMNKQRDMLASIGVEVKAMKDAKDEFPKYFTKSILLDSEGKVIEETKKEDLASDKDKAFSLDVKKQYKAWKGNQMKQEEMVYPLFEVEKEGEKLYVIPLIGTGLWGPIWGFMSLKEDAKTIYGTSFGHQGETPGLGAEITTEPFESQFKGKTFNNYTGPLDFETVKVVKAGKEKENQVAGIAGGTITSVGVDEMIERTMKVYTQYFANNK